LNEGVRDHGFNVLRQVIKVDDLRRRLWPQAIQPVEEFHQHFQSPLLAVLHCPAHNRLYFFLIRIIYKTEVLLLQRDGVVEEEQFGVFEHDWDSVCGEVPREGTCDVGEHEGNVLGQGFREDGGQSRQCIVGTDSNPRDSAISKDENGSDGVDVLLNLSSNILLVDLVLLNTASVGQPRCVEDANLGRRLRTRYVQSASTHHNSAVAHKFVKAGRVGLTLIAGTLSFVAAIEDFEVVAINIVADKDISDEFQDCRFADTSLPNKEDGVICLDLVLRCLDDPPLERLYVARKYGQNRCIKDAILLYLTVGASSSSSSSIVCVGTKM
jgi:hypothetical protein